MIDILSVASQSEGVPNGKGLEGTFLGDRNSLYLNMIHQNTVDNILLLT